MFIKSRYNYWRPHIFRLLSIMTRRCLVCGQVPSSEYTFPKNMNEAIKWQSMLGVHVPVKTLRHKSCVCNKHINCSQICKQQDRENCSGQIKQPQNRNDSLRLSAAQPIPQSICDSTTAYSVDDTSERKGSGCDNTRSLSSCTRPRCCVSSCPNLKKQVECKIKRGCSPGPSCQTVRNAINSVTSIARSMGKPQHNDSLHNQNTSRNRKPTSPSKSRTQFARPFPNACMSVINEDPERNPVNVLIMGGCMLPTYYNSAAARSPETEICVLESNLGNEKVIFKDIDVPKFTVCRTPTEKPSRNDVGVGTHGVQQESSTEVLLVGLTENESNSCICPNNPSCVESDKKITPPQDCSNHTQNECSKVDDLEDLLAKQQKLLQTIQATLNDMHRLLNCSGN